VKGPPGAPWRGRPVYRQKGAMAASKPRSGSR
jgi:hypothetical protein